MDSSNLIPVTFKIIGGTILICVLSVVFFEYHNVTKAVFEFAHTSRQLMEESCEFFAKESYRGSSAQVSNKNVDLSFGNSYGIKDKSGATKVSGKFYQGVDEKEVWNNLYGDGIYAENSHDYINWLDQQISAVGDFNKEENLTYKLLYNTLNGYGSTKNDPFRGDYLYVTPLNLGFTYIDQDTLLKIFRWKLVNELSVISVDSNDYTKRDRFFTDENGRDYVKWRGFRVYYNEIHVDVSIANDRVKLYDLYNEDQRLELMDWTSNIFKQEDVDEYDKEGYMDFNQISKDDIRRFKILYDVRWSVPVSYEGILPIKLVLNLITNKENNSYTITEGQRSFLPRFNNTINITVDTSTKLVSVMQSTPTKFISNEVFIDRFRMGNGLDNTKMGNRNSDGELYRYNDESTRYLGDNTHNTLGFAQNLHYCFIH